MCRISDHDPVSPDIQCFFNYPVSGRIVVLSGRISGYNVNNFRTLLEENFRTFFICDLFSEFFYFKIIFAIEN